MKLSLENSIYRHVANTTQKWCPSDDYANWVGNNKDPQKKALLDKLGWTEDNVSYRFNEQGFRSDDFEGEGAMFLGCSHTVGIGVDWERTWVYKVANALNLKCWNLGIGGGSHDTAFRNAYHWIPKLKPKYVFFLAPLPYRFELITRDEFVQYLPFTATAVEDEEFFIRWAGVPENSRMNVTKNTLAIKYICQENNVTLIHHNDQRVWMNASKDYARDLMHHGVSWHQMIADDMLRKLGEIA